MAMLAEPRRKQKWSLNPRGKQWSDDSNKFGQKMLEKMGWTSGKGLGASEQGMTEHVKVSYKNDTSGIGFKDTDDQWAQHQEDFNDFLSKLQQQNGQPNEDNGDTVDGNPPTNESLEMKSRQSRARVHYTKFTRGKDVKRYSSKDLANIFGKRDSVNSNIPSKADEIKDIPVDPLGSTDTTAGVLTIKGGNMNDYFKGKMPALVRNVESTVEYESDAGSEAHLNLGFGFNSTQNCEKEVVNPYEISRETNVNGKEKSTSSKKRKKEIDIEVGAVISSGEGFVNPALNLGDAENEEKNGAEYEVSRVVCGTDNRALDLADEKSNRKRVTFNDDVEYEIDSPRKKRKKRKLDKFEVENDKLKRIKEEVPDEIPKTPASDVVGFVNQALDVEIVDEATNDNELNERKMRKSRKKKERRKARINLETIPESIEEHVSIHEIDAIGEAVLLDDSTSNLNDLDIKNVADTETTENVVPKKNKKKKSKSKDTEDLDDGSKVETEKKKNKEKSKRSCSLAVVEEAVERVTEVDAKVESEVGTPEVEGTKKNKKRKKSKQLGGENSDPNASTMGIGNSEENSISESHQSEHDNEISKKIKFEEKTDTENVQNLADHGSPRDRRLPKSREQKGNKSKNLLKSFFAKAPTLNFVGSNINKIPGYGNGVMDMKR